MKIRRGIALIELIFAIVVIAITLLAVPNLISQTTKSSKEAITQEAISNAASELDMVMSSFWDENCTNPSVNNPVLVVQSGAPGLNEVNTTMPKNPATTVKSPTRVGSPDSTSRRFLAINGVKLTATPTQNFGFDINETEPDDIDDYNGRGINLISTAQNTSATEGDYKDTKIQLSLSVSYISDTPAIDYNRNVVDFSNPFNNIMLNSTNIKMITLTLTSNNDKSKKIVLKSFSCNIGNGIPKEKVF